MRARIGPRIPNLMDSDFDNLYLEGVPEGIAAVEVWEEAEGCR